MLIAIDPGASGGIAWEGQGGFVKSEPMPATEKDVVQLIATLATAAKVTPSNSRCIIEKVGGYIGARTTYIACPRCKQTIPVSGGQPGSAMFTFGRGVGVLIGAVLMAGIPLEELTPQTWQKIVGVGTHERGMSKTDWYNKLKGKAQALFPTEKVTHKTAAALLILEAGRRMMLGRSLPF